MIICWLDLLKRTFRRWMDVRAPRLSAALAFYSIFSIAPLLVIIIGKGHIRRRSRAHPHRPDGRPRDAEAPYHGMLVCRQPKRAQKGLRMANNKNNEKLRRRK
jgi:hypothetical protein